MFDAEPQGKEPDITLNVNGTKFSRWQTVEIRNSIDELAGSFSLGFQNSWAPEGEALGIQEGDECTIECDGEVVLTGFVDRSRESYQKREHVVSVEGRSVTEDLIDCDAIYGGGRIKGKGIVDLSKLILEPFGIALDDIEPALLADPAFTAPIEPFKLQEGETAFEALSRIARKRSCMLLTTRDGKLQIARASKSPLPGVTLQRGLNVISGEREGDASNRFSEYRFKSQLRGTDSVNGKNAAHLSGVVTDSAIERYRPKVIFAEHQGTREDLKKRATWERNTRAGRGERLTYSVKGWKHSPGAASPLPSLGAVDSLFGGPSKSSFWTPNTATKVVDDFFGYDGETMLIAMTVLRRTREEGTRAHITVTGVESYDVYEPPPARRGRRR